MQTPRWIIRVESGVTHLECLLETPDWTEIVQLARADYDMDPRSRNERWVITLLIARLWPRREIEQELGWVQSTQK